MNSIIAPIADIGMSYIGKMYGEHLLIRKMYTRQPILSFQCNFYSLSQSGIMLQSGYKLLFPGWQALYSTSEAMTAHSKKHCSVFLKYIASFFHLPAKRNALPNKIFRHKALVLILFLSTGATRLNKMKGPCSCFNTNNSMLYLPRWKWFALTAIVLKFHFKM